MLTEEIIKGGYENYLGGKEFVGMTADRFWTTYHSRQKHEEKIPTGVEQIDRLIGGIQKGKVTSLLGVTGSLKSTWALNIGYLAQAQGLNVLYLALEMSQYEITCNLLSRHSNSGKYRQPVKCSDIKNSYLTREEKEQLYTVIYPDYEKLPRKNVYCR